MSPKEVIYETRGKTNFLFCTSSCFASSTLKFFEIYHILKLQYSTPFRAVKRSSKGTQKVLNRFEDIFSFFVIESAIDRYRERCLIIFVYLAGSALQLTPVQPVNDFVDASEVSKVIQLKGYFKGSSNSWNHGLDGVHHDITLPALGTLIDHLSRLMVSSLACLL